MLVESFLVVKECNSFEEVKEILKQRNEKGFNEFIISIEKDFPYMVMLVKDNFACLNFFKEEDDAGYSSINSETILCEEDFMIFYTNVNEEVEVVDYSIISFEKALLVVEEFYITNSLPKCIEWEEL